MLKVITALLVVFATSGVAGAQTAPPDVIKELAPTGKLRAAMNFGNPVLVQKAANGEPVGVTPELAAALAKRLGVPGYYVRIAPAAASTLSFFGLLYLPYFMAFALK